MFYARINKIKVFDNREGFLWFNRRAELRIYSYVAGNRLFSTLSSQEWETDSTLSSQERQTVTEIKSIPEITVQIMLDLPDEAARKQLLLDTVIGEAGRFAQSSCLEINGVKDNQTLLFGDSGLAIYRNDSIPETLDIQLWVIESDSDIRSFALDADKVIDSDTFKGLFAAVETALTVTNPVLSGAIAVGGVVVNLLRQKLRANKDDLVGYWQASLNRAEHYPHGVRNKQDVYDTTGNILVDYTLFGFENAVN
jgi:hypothetical protein